MKIRVVVHDKLSNVTDFLTYESGDFNVSIGDLIIVPFGIQKRRAIVVALEDSSCPWPLEFTKKGAPVSYKILNRIVTQQLMSAESVALALWISEYYQSPLFHAIRLFVPTSVWTDSVSEVFEEYITFVNDGDTGRAHKQRELLDALLALSLDFSQPQKTNDILERVGVGSKVLLKQLVSRGLVGLEKRKRSRSMVSGFTQETESVFDFTDEQQKVFDVLSTDLFSESPSTYVLEGVTGSGKTEVYMRLVADMLKRKEDATAIVLVPEISLTPQTVQRFVNRFGHKIALWHSRLSAGEKMDEWQRIAEGEVSIVIGSRSALFLPLKNIGCIIVDEEHDTSYKQGSSPRYVVRDVVRKMGEIYGATVLLASATPAFESYHLVSKGAAQLLQMNHRCVGQLPKLQLVDMSAERRDKNYSIFSYALQDALSKTLAKKEQAIVFLNRRGSARTLSCQECSWEAKCPQCDIPYVVHRFVSGGKYVSKLLCHYCSDSQQIPFACPECGDMNIEEKGVGTQRVQMELQSAFPQAKILRMDKDTTGGKHDHEIHLAAFKNREYDILVGTQMIAKGLDIPSVSLVAVVQSDVGMHLPDFRATERLAQLLLQVSGRAGRSDVEGLCIFQTNNAAAGVLSFVMNNNYRRFVDHEMESRKLFSYPPFEKLTKIIFRGKDYAVLHQEAQSFVTSLSEKYPQHSISGPAMAFIPKIGNEYRIHVYIKGVISSLKDLLTPSAIVDVDPYDMS